MRTFWNWNGTQGQGVRDRLVPEVWVLVEWEDSTFLEWFSPQRCSSESAGQSTLSLWRWSQWVLFKGRIPLEEETLGLPWRARGRAQVQMCSSSPQPSSFPLHSSSGMSCSENDTNPTNLWQLFPSWCAMSAQLGAACAPSPASAHPARRQQTEGKQSPGQDRQTCRRKLHVPGALTSVWRHRRERRASKTTLGYFTSITAFLCGLD